MRNTKVKVVQSIKLATEYLKWSLAVIFMSYKSMGVFIRHINCHIDNKIKYIYAFN